MAKRQAETIAKSAVVDFEAFYKAREPRATFAISHNLVGIPAQARRPRLDPLELRVDKARGQGEQVRR